MFVGYIIYYFEIFVQNITNILQISITFFFSLYVN